MDMDARINLFYALVLMAGRNEETLNPLILGEGWTLKCDLAELL